MENYRSLHSQPPSETGLTKRIFSIRATGAKLSSQTTQALRVHDEALQGKTTLTTKNNDFSHQFKSGENLLDQTLVSTRSSCQISSIYITKLLPGSNLGREESFKLHL